MSAVIDTVRELLLSSFKEILAAGTAGVVLYVRAWWQSHAAVNAAEEVERQTPALPGPEKKRIAMMAVHERLPRGVRPLSEGGLDRLVQKSVPEAKKRVSKRPSAPPEGG